MADDIADPAAGSNGALPLLRLYIARGTPISVRAEANLAAAISAAGLRYDVEIVDVFKDAVRALVDRVLVTPTLLLIGPDERQMVVGDLGDSSELSRLLGTIPVNGAE